MGNRGLPRQQSDTIYTLSFVVCPEPKKSSPKKEEKRAASFKINLFLVTIDDLLKRNRILKEVVVIALSFLVCLITPI